MRNILKWGFGTAAILLVCGGSANAQNACRGKVFVDSVYQNGLGGTNYEYFVQVRNSGSTTMKVDLKFGAFGSKVSLFSPSLPGIALEPHASKTIKFGRGTDGNVNTGTVQVTYDSPGSGAKPYVTALNCK